ncbi:MAG: MMPL family transporter [Flavobacteriaceae bacterium]|jgi:predicted RND superfamily exporter protein|nr:MMPL family transporter [Flavobacteriaceae bacterium]MDG1940824.1 MMPL family transporter [Flavobacteriaceae bacterium]
MNKSKNSFAEKWGEFVVKYKWAVLLLSIILALGLGSQGKMEFDGDYHVFFSKSNPELEAFDGLQEKYSKVDNIIMVLAPNNKNIFTKENLIAIEELTAEAWNTPYSSRVDALTNYQHTRAEGDDLYVEDLSYESENLTTERVKEIKKIALGDPVLVNRLVNKEGSVAAINVTVRLPGIDSAKEIPEITVASRAMIAAFKEKYPQFDVYVSGNVPLNTAFFESSQNDLALIGIMFLIVIAVTLLLTRNIFATLATLVVVMLSIISAVGFIGLSGIKLTAPSSVFPTMILTLAVADSIHILVTLLQKFRKEGYQKKEAIIESMRLNYMPVFITSVTTVVGFLTLNFGEVPPFWHLGNITAFGMSMAFLYSTTTLPALMAIFPIWKSSKDEAKNQKKSFYTSLGQFVAKQPIRLTIISSTFIIGMTLMALQNVFNDSFVDYFDKSVKFRTDSDFINENLTGIYNAEFSIGSGESGGINNPIYLEKLNAFEEWLNEQEEVIHVNSFAEVTRKINKSMHDDDDSYYKVPTNRQEAAQYLLLYELSLPFGLDLNNQINVDKSETRLTVVLQNLGSKKMLEFTSRAEKWLEENTPEYMHAIGVSPTVMFAKLGFRQADSMIKGNIIALLLISLVLMLALKSFKMGAISLIPNLTPVIVGFGFWAFYLAEINTGMVVVFGVTLGIIVDDTVHFMSKFLRARRELNYNAKDSVIYAFETVGRALVITTLVLVAGFTVLSTSPFALNSYMARITVVIITAALVIDFILLPSILILVYKEKNTLKDAL